jgi:hypothetical protein
MTDKWVEYKINKSKFAEFIGYAATADDKCGSWWLPTADGGQLRIMVGDDE